MEECSHLASTKPKIIHYSPVIISEQSWFIVPIVQYHKYGPLLKEGTSNFDEEQINENG